MLHEAAARSVMIGVGPSVPPPVMSGLEARRPSVTQQTWQAAPQPVNAAARYPPMAAADAEHYRAIFAQMDTDRDGYIQARGMQAVRRICLRPFWLPVATNFCVLCCLALFIIFCTAASSC